MRPAVTRKLKAALCVTLLATLLGACNESPEDSPQAERIASTAKMTIVEPAQGAEITGHHAWPPQGPRQEPLRAPAANTAQPRQVR